MTCCFQSQGHLNVVVFVVKLLFCFFSIRYYQQFLRFSDTSSVEETDSPKIHDSNPISHGGGGADSTPLPLTKEDRHTVVD